VLAQLHAGEAYPALIATPEVLRMTALAGGQPVTQTIEIRRTGGADHEWRHATTRRKRWLDIKRDGDALVLTGNPTGLTGGTYSDTIRIVGRDGTVLAQAHVEFYLAAPGIGQIVATELPWSWGVAVHSGRILQASYGWDQLGMRPRPRLLQLWDGNTHPRTLTRLGADALYAPIIDPRDGAAFVLARARDGNFLYQIRPNGDAHVIAQRIGSNPAYGAALLPDGSIAVAEWDGLISHVRRDGSVTPWMSLGVNIYQIASDGDGNIFAATFSGDVMRITPAGEVRVIETGFGAGRLVAVATTPAGDLIAAERGGQGRILLIRDGGRRDVVYRSGGAHYYGLAVDGRFVYALDLTQRHLLRFPLPESSAVIARGDAQD
jgi:hypothetical protein